MTTANRPGPHQPVMTAQPCRAAQAFRRVRWLLVMSLMILCVGCAGPGRWPADDASATASASRVLLAANPAGIVEDTQASRCLDWLHTADRLVAAQSVGDAMHSRVSGYPFLRVSRFLASYAREVNLPAQQRYWLEQLRALDQQARGYEITNLDESARTSLQQEAASSIETYLHDCGQRLVAALAGERDAMSRLLEQVFVPDDYSISLRALGVYPVTRWPFLYGVRRWHAATRDTFARAGSAQLARQAWLTFVPGAIEEGRTAASASPPSLTSARANPLSIPMPDSRQLAALLQRHAPIVRVAQKSRADLPGMPIWRTAADYQSLPLPDVDEARPVLTVRTGHTRVNGLPLLQLSYTVWFSARPLTGPFDLLGGAIDGLTWRVTLDPAGRAWAYDTIHPCGCYHLFFPGPRAKARPDALKATTEEGLFLIQPLPEVGDGQRLQISLAADTHYVQSVQVVEETALHGVARSLQMVDEDQLRSLPLFAGRTRSWYRPDGLVAGTERGERLLFWPMGIQSAGAMRQPGRQATAFVGRRHFDDADLFDRYFEFVRPLNPAR